MRQGLVTKPEWVGLVRPGLIDQVWVGLVLTDPVWVGLVLADNVWVGLVFAELWRNDCPD